MDSKLHIPPANYHLLSAQQEPYKKGYLVKKNVGECSGDRTSEEWTINKKMTRPKEQLDKAEKSKTRDDRKGELNGRP